MSDDVDVELMHFDDCALWQGTAERLRAAMRATGLDPTRLRYRTVTAEESPADFPGSPTILVNGRDPFPHAAPVGPTCRRYPTERGPDLAPSREQLIAVLSR